MEWPDEGTATREYKWLRLMAATKYDGYSDFRAGSRFIENLAVWLKQFDLSDRKCAYDFIKNRLVYISGAEMQRIIEAFVPEIVTPYLRRLVAEKIGIAPHEVWGNNGGFKAFRQLLRRSIFVGLSDGARIDILRRANAGLLSQEQIVPMMNVDKKKWEDLGNELRGTEGTDAYFDHVYLIDDFTASGTTLIRKVGGEWKGKLKKFNDLVREARKEAKDAKTHFPISEHYTVHIHHYISTTQAKDALHERIEAANRDWKERDYKDIDIKEGMLLLPTLKLCPSNDRLILKLCEKYYDHELYTRLERHCDETGQKDMKLGYADCALPLVLEHNTPNNSIPLLWAETTGKQGHSMRPLFRRRDRHS